MTEMMIAAALGYLAGSVPFGLVCAYLAGLGDIRKIGSGNIGATNVLRTGHKLAAFGTLIGDAGKGGAIVALMLALGWTDLAPVAGLAAVIGHCYPLWLGFKGGKGVATAIATLAVLYWPAGLFDGYHMAHHVSLVPHKLIICASWFCNSDIDKRPLF